jgi:hypothetical protein
LTPEAVLAAADDPDANTKKDQVCEANFYSGEFALLQGAKDEAARLFRLAASSRLTKADPNNAGWQRELSVSYSRLAYTYGKTGQLPEARQQQLPAGPGESNRSRDEQVVAAQSRVLVDHYAILRETPAQFYSPPLP